VVLNGVDEDAKSIMKGSLYLIKDVHGSTSEDDRTCLVLLASTELDHLVLSDHDLLYAGAESKDLVSPLGSIKCGHNLSSSCCSNSLNAFEVSMFDYDDALLYSLKYFSYLYQPSTIRGNCR